MITEETKHIIRLALEEDLTDRGDITSDWLIREDQAGEGWVEARQDAVVSGLMPFKEIFLTVDPLLEVTLLCEDGASVKPMNRVATITGNAKSILKAERTALNFLSHLSGISTKTAEFVAATQAWGTQILCTRKTNPGLRELEVAAVRHGRGDTFRSNLSDAVLVKDNHLGIIGGVEDLAEIVGSSQEGKDYLNSGKLEVLTMYELELAVKMGWKQLLLDNFTVEQVAEAVERWGEVVNLEASGGINEDNLKDYAATGVHAISMGAITHSVRIADFSLEVDWKRNPQG
ncbi:carboxylating nicotinate-nucleotide diphosphorylase [bacterium]|nr:MAG: carboxylating nicotinate-nucleotide diphosphorylase [bacterium]